MTEDQEVEERESPGRRKNMVTGTIKAQEAKEAQEAKANRGKRRSMDLEMTKHREQKEAREVTGMKDQSAMTGDMVINQLQLREVMTDRKVSLLRW